MAAWRAPWPVLATSAAALLLPGLSLGVPSGYSYGALLLLLCALVTPHRWARGPWGPRTAWLLAAVAFMGADWLVDAVVSQTGWRGLDKPIKYLLALPCLLLVVRFPPRARLLWAGVALGGMLSGAVALQQTLLRGLPRAEGYTNAIQYGNLSLLLALMCLAGALTWPPGPRRGPWLVAFGAGASLGLLGSVLSQSRGGWLALAFVLPVVAWLLRDRVPRQRLAVVAGALGLGLLLLLAAMGPKLAARMEAAWVDVQVYEATGNAESSVGQRLAHWKAAWHMGLERPLFGWTQAGYEVEKARLVARGEVHPFVLQFNHAHNEVLDVWAKRGGVGVLALLGLYAAPLLMFWPRRRDPACPEADGLRLLGLLLPLSYIGFGLTQGFLGHNSGTVFYLFMALLVHGALMGLSAPAERR